MKEWFNEYKKVIFSTIIVVCILLLGFSIVYGLINGSIKTFIDEFIDIISPLIIGFAIAYLSNPIVSFFETRVFKFIRKMTIRRLFSIVVTFILIILCIAFVFTMLIPSLVSTVVSFWDTYVINYETSLKNLAIRLNSILDGIPFFDTAQRIDPDAIVSWVQEQFPWLDDLVSGDFSDMLPSTPNNDSNDNTNGLPIDIESILSTKNLLSLFGYAISFGSSVFNGVKNTVFGIFIAIYMLLSKERISAYIRRFLNSIFEPSKVRSIVRFGKLLDRSFGGFIEGQILDAAIVGIMSYFIFIVFDMPIAHLLATIIAVTNIIPVLGPFIGGIPAAILVFLTAPEKTIIFVILIIVIQQIDGNIICPNILGDKINISSLATIAAILIMGGLFGILGMLIGVPVFAVAIHLINNATMNALRRKGLDTSLKHYYVGDLDCIFDKDEKKSKFTLKSVKEIFTNVKKVFTKNNKKEKK